LAASPAAEDRFSPKTTAEKEIPLRIAGKGREFPALWKIRPCCKGLGGPSRNLARPIEECRLRRELLISPLILHLTDSDKFAALRQSRKNQQERGKKPPSNV
jgi:hypothetical protein